MKVEIGTERDGGSLHHTVEFSAVSQWSLFFSLRVKSIKAHFFVVVTHSKYLAAPHTHITGSFIAALQYRSHACIAKLCIMNLKKLYFYSYIEYIHI